MKIYSDPDNIDKNVRSAVTVGTFDGLHLGHMKIVRTVLEIAQKINGQSVLVTFEPHPRSIVSKNFDLKLITTFDEKKKLLEKTGIDNLVLINFTKEFSEQTSEQFIKNYIVDKFGAAHMIVGHDHKFGKDRNGNEDKLRELGKLHNFYVTSVPGENINGEIISSTIIRNALAEGNIEKANLLLGRNYSFSGVVVEGAKRGRTLGFPTANIRLDDERKSVPKRGVYIVSCELGNEHHYGIMNIGMRPTFENKKELVIEVHILNFNKDIYGEHIKTDFLKRMRDERKFESKEELIHQIEEDKKQAVGFINVLAN